LVLDNLCVAYFVASITMRYASETVNGVSASCGISSPQKAVNSMSKRFFTWRFM